MPLQAYNAVDAGLVSSFAPRAGCALLAVQTVMVLAVLRLAAVAAAAPVTYTARFGWGVARNALAARARGVCERSRVQTLDAVHVHMPDSLVVNVQQ